MTQIISASGISLQSPFLLIWTLFKKAAFFFSIVIIFLYLQVPADIFQNKSQLASFWHSFISTFFTLIVCFV